MTQTLARQDALVKTHRRQELKNIVLNRLIPGLALPHYLLVRNPYARIESFFKEKLRKCILKATETPPYQLKLHQQIFYPFLSLEIGDDVKDIQKRFLELTFDEFVKLLPKVFDKDTHLKPQSQALRTQVKDLFYIHIKYTKILKIEDRVALEFLKNELALDMEIRINKTTDKFEEIKWDRELREIVNSIYIEDFKNFGYELIVNE